MKDEQVLTFYPSSFILLSGTDSEGHFATRRDFAVYGSDPGGFAHYTAKLEYFHFQPQNVARHDLLFEAHAVKPTEESQPPLVFLHTQQSYRADLGQRFHYQNPRHYRVAWEMPLEKPFVDRYIFEADRSFAVLDLNYFIHQQKRKAMRHNRLYFGAS